MLNVGSPRELFGIVFISQRGSSIRVAPHLDVTESDVQQFFAALDVVVASSAAAR